METKILMLLVVSLFFITGISAQPSFLQDPEFIEGYEIKIPIIGTIPEGQSISFHFHVFNISNGVAIDNSTTNCSFHLYNNSGSHIFIKSPLTIFDNEFDFEVMVDGGNFTVGEYSYIIQCESSTYDLGGFESVSIIVTKTGILISIQEVLLLVFALSLLFLLCLGLFIASFKVEHPGVRVFLWGLCLLFFIAIVGFTLDLSTDYLNNYSDFNSNYSTFFTMLTYLTYALGGGVILWLIAFALNKFHDLRGLSDE
ncbi:MAG: hypothetical protein ACTSQA_00990 [Candidatus Heimdallarchaeaceae archaeon]